MDCWGHRTNRGSGYPLKNETGGDLLEKRGNVWNEKEGSYAVERPPVVMCILGAESVGVNRAYRTSPLITLVSGVSGFQYKSRSSGSPRLFLTLCNSSSEK